MAKLLTMPKIGVNMTEAVIVEWLVKVGDRIKEGDHILDAETDKAVQEITSTMSGVIAEIIAPVGATVPCQEPIARLVEADEADVGGSPAARPLAKPPATQAPPEAAAPHSAAPQAPVASAPTPAASPAEPAERLRASPLARKTAADLHLDWRLVRPARPGARVVRADVLAHAAATTQGAATPPPAAGIALSGARRVIAERMSESARTKPSAAITLHAEADRLLAWRAELKKSGVEAGYTDMLVLILAKALRLHPLMNSTFEGGEIRLQGSVNIGVAVDTDRGLHVPVIVGADKKGIAQIAEELRTKAAAARAGRLPAGDQGSFTITSLGMHGIESFTPLINPPECCILGVGAILREPVVREGDRIEVVSRLALTLVFDHRIVDGAPAARFLQSVKSLIERPLEGE